MERPRSANLRPEFKVTSKRFKDGSWDQAKSRVRKARAIFKDLALDQLRVSVSQVRNQAANNMG